MDRRYNNMAGTGTSHLMRPSSFIPTSNHHGGSGHNGPVHNGVGSKMGPSQIQQLAMQSQLQAQSHNHIQIPSGAAPHNSGSNLQQHQQSQHQQPQHQQQHTNYYQNLPPNHHNSFGTNGRHTGTIPRLNVAAEQHHHQQQQHQSQSHLAHHHSQQQQQQQTQQQQQQQQIQQQQHNTRQIKSYQSHYGNTTTVGNGHLNGNSLYGNLTGGLTVRHHGVAIPQPQQPQQQQQQHDPQLHQAIPAIQPVINQIQQQHHSSKISQHYANADTDGLPPTLVESMRTLFDILDDTKEGKVRLSDIESRWENNNDLSGIRGNTGAEPLIKMGVMGYLRKVTPPDGMLSFDRFCSGLRLALLTNNNNLSSVNQNQLSYLSNNNSSSLQANVQPHIKNMTNNFYSSANGNQSLNLVKVSAVPISGQPVANSTSTGTMQRMSKIPGISTSRLPTLNTSGSGIPVSPKAKLNTSNTYSNSPVSFANQSHINGPHAAVNGAHTARRIPLSQSQHEQGTTVALVHQPPPPPNPKPGGAKNGDLGTLRNSRQSPVAVKNGGLTKSNRYANKNGSLDNLKTENEVKSGNKPLTSKDRPPSAPILDTTDDDDGVHEYYANRSGNKRDRARSRDRETEDRERERRLKSPAEELSNFGKRVVSFVTPRQRTLSMPQLQVSKLKPKSINLDGESSPSPSTSSHSPPSSAENKPPVLKSSLKSQSQLIQPSLVSSIPTKMVKQKSDVAPSKSDSLQPNSVSSKFNDQNQIESSVDKEQPPPPPKPPRNNALTVSTSLGLVGMQDHPHSESSTGSGTLNNPSKPEIRNFLQSWKKGVVERKPDELPPVANVGANVEAAAKPEIPEPGGLAGTEVKLRGDKKTNQRRRETPRRHTVQSGIDFATLKRLKQLEQERDVLQQGVSFLDSAKEWYTKNLDGVDEKITLLTKGAPITDYGTESHEERLNLLGCRISEVNGLLTALMDGSSRLPTHMNLQIPSHLSMRTITRLKEQNRQLTQEVSDQSHRVTQLETEKAMLLRQLFHQKNNLHPDETVYM